MIIENKIVGDLMDRSPFVRQEIRKINNKVDTLEVEFYNGSSIISFPVGTDGSKIRGLRLQFTIIDEYAQMNKTIVDRVINLCWLFVVVMKSTKQTIQMMFKTECYLLLLLTLNLITYIKQ